MKTITLMCGLPRSGKTTWIKNNNKEGVIILSADTLRHLIYNQDFWKDGENLVWAIRDIMLKAVLEQGADVIIDETNTMVSRRKPIIALAKKYGYTINCYAIDTDAENCIQRAVANKQEELIKMTFLDAERLTYQGKTLATWKKSKATTKFDAKTFQKDNPELAERYMITSEGSRRFLIK